MARRAPFRSRGRRLAATAAGLLLLAGCTSIPARLPASAPELHLAAGTLLYAGKQYEGSVFELSPAGDTLAVRSYRAGRLEGTARQWYGPGRLREQRRYVAGREEGLAEGWWPNGQLRFRRPFRAGLYEGLVQEWYANGQPERRGYFVAGQEAGRQQLWQADGTLRANYEARNGRQYGFIGTKHCTSDRL